MTIGTELKPCPFCGDEAFVAVLNDTRQVWCLRDMCARGPFRDNTGEAIAAWNARTASSTREA